MINLFKMKGIIAMFISVALIAGTNISVYAVEENIGSYTFKLDGDESGLEYIHLGEQTNGNHRIMPKKFYSAASGTMSVSAADGYKWASDGSSGEKKSLGEYKDYFPSFAPYMQLVQWDNDAEISVTYSSYMSMPSVSEYKGNSDAKLFADVFWVNNCDEALTRTFSSQGVANQMFFGVVKYNGTEKDGDIKSEYKLNQNGTYRFAFTFDVSDEFFKNVKIDVSTAGENIKNTILSNFLRYELASLYTALELEALGYEDDYILNCDFSKNIFETGELTITPKIKNNTGSSVDNPTIYIAVYDSTGEISILQPAEKDGETEPRIETPYDPVTITIPAEAENGVLAVYAINSDGSPYSKPAIFSGILSKPTEVSVNNIDVNYNKSNYSFSISGTKAELAGKELFINITDNANQMVYVSQITADENGKYGVCGSISDTLDPQIMKVSVVYETGELNAFFDYKDSLLSSINSCSDASTLYNSIIIPNDMFLSIDDGLKAKYSANTEIWTSICNKLIEAKPYENLTSVSDKINVLLAVVEVSGATTATEAKTAVEGYNKYLKLDTQHFLAQEYSDYVYGKIAAEEFATLENLSDLFYKSCIMQKLNRTTNYVDIYGILEASRTKIENFSTEAIDMTDYFAKTSTTDADIHIAGITQYDVWNTFVTRFNEAVQIVPDPIIVPSPGGNSGSSGRPSSPSGNVSPNLSISKQEQEGQKEDVVDISFSDIDDAEWAKEAIQFLAENGVVVGKENGKFYPHDKVTRAEFIKMFVVAFKLESSEIENINFTDIDNSDWCCEYVQTAAGLGLISGYANGEFGKSDNITRQDIAVIMYRAKSLIGISNDDYWSKDFADHSSMSEYATDAIYNLKQLGIINGRDNNMFAPKENATRAEAVTLIYNLLMYTK